MDSRIVYGMGRLHATFRTDISMVLHFTPLATKFTCLWHFRLSEGLSTFVYDQYIFGYLHYEIIVVYTCGDTESDKQAVAGDTDLTYARPRSIGPQALSVVTSNLTLSTSWRNAAAVPSA
ncbi:hypothetical protein CHS0354_012568 [Potamilus streckersoni]|uniref:Uncharacterized protein n=1 Tax=Potamilus streckersoni TaxID=2493646 RepID=A0AAE0W492_9BIVA|nr:hypothetical protein CHS0354_012568 [Potamilus streckersoni]